MNAHTTPKAAKKPAFSNIIYFRQPITGKRVEFRTGLKNEREFQKWNGYVYALKDAIDHATEPAEDARKWAESRPYEVRQRLAALGLVKAATLLPTGLKAYMEAYTATKSHAATVQKETTMLSRLLKFFPANFLVRNLTKGAVIDWQNKMRNATYKKGEKTVKYAENTIRKDACILRAALEWGVSHGVLRENVAKGKEIKVSVTPAKADRRYKVGDAEARRTMQELKGEYRPYYALLRWAGLRKEEPRLLRWQDLNWDSLSIRIKETKPGRPGRTCPMFDGTPIRQELAAYWKEMGRPTEGLVFPEIHGKSEGAITNAITRAIKAAGLEKYPRLCQSLRCTASNEIEDKYGGKKEAAWVGHSMGEAARSYLRTGEEDVVEAVKEGLADKVLSDTFSQKTQNQDKTQDRTRQSEAVAASEAAAENFKKHGEKRENKPVQKKAHIGKMWAKWAVLDSNQ